MDRGAAARFAAGYRGAAAAYADVLDPTQEGVARRIVELAHVEAGERVLDLATGTGTVAREAARRGAVVVGIDVAEAMLALARERSPSTIVYEAADAASLPFGEEAFDVVICGFGLSHMPDVSSVLAEIRRVLAPGGRFVESSWGGDGENEAFQAILEHLKVASGGELHAFADILDEGTWADPERAVGVLSTAGFTVEVVIEPLRGHYADAAAALDRTLAWPDYRETVARLTKQTRNAFENRALAAAADTKKDWWFAINYFVATKPC